jgi:gliding motility-associatede transport system auxiliary component
MAVARQKKRRTRKRLEPVQPQKGGVTRTFKVLAAAGVLSAALIAVLVNVLVARFYKRWDWTSSKLYTLSAATIETLHSLSAPVDVIVLLSQSDNLTESVRQMLAAYGAQTRELHATYVDPDRDPARFLAVQQKYGIRAGKTDNGRVVTDASIVIARGNKHWFVTTDDMMSYDPGDGRVRPKLEQALTEGIVNVLSRQRARICFTKGHNEISLDGAGPHGLAELHYRLQKNNYDVESINLVAPHRKNPLLGCRAVVVAGPEVAFDAESARELTDYFTGGGSVMLLTNPVLDENDHIRPTGLEGVARAGGVVLDDDFLIERDPTLRLPQGLGESYFATPKRQAVTRGLVDEDGKALFRVVVSAAQSLKATESGTPQALLVTSSQAFGVKDIRPFVDENKPVEKGPEDEGGPFTVAMASEIPKPADSKSAHGPRMVVVGSANVAWNQNWRDTTLLGDRLFMESAVSWLSAEPALVSVPQKPSHAAGLRISAASVSEIRNYVLMYMPGAALLLGAFILYRRRSVERRSRRRDDPAPSDDEPAARDPADDGDEP